MVMSMETRWLSIADYAVKNDVSLHHPPVHQNE